MRIIWRAFASSSYSIEIIGVIRAIRRRAFILFNFVVLSFRADLAFLCWKIKEIGLKASNTILSIPKRCRRPTNTHSITIFISPSSAVVMPILRNCQALVTTFAKEGAFWAINTFLIFHIINWVIPITRWALSINNIRSIPLTVLVVKFFLIPNQIIFQILTGIPRIGIIILDDRIALQLRCTHNIIVRELKFARVYQQVFQILILFGEVVLNTKKIFFVWGVLLQLWNLHTSLLEFALDRHHWLLNCLCLCFIEDHT